jgi:agmatine deiminase
MPAEWEPHRGTWVSWPHNEETWPDELTRVEETFAAAVAVLAASETVHVNVNTPEDEARARQTLAGVQDHVVFHHIPTNDAWVRDYGPIFITDPDGRLAATTWGFNSWGEKYPPFDLDDAAAEKMANELGTPIFAADMILEGGSIEVNGAGMLITTESCLLNPNRNPHLTRSDIEERLRGFLGVEQIVWLRDGIAGDDTDGHIDDLTRFVGERTIVTVVESDLRSHNHSVLHENLQRLHQLRTADGAVLDVVELPMPAPRLVKGEMMPASYANFYIGNEVVLLPTYHDPNDDRAMDLLQSLLPTREVVGIDCTDLIWGLGAFHCLTQQIPVGG